MAVYLVGTAAHAAAHQPMRKQLNTHTRQKGRKLRPNERPTPIAGALSYTLTDASRLSGLSVATLRRRAAAGDLRLFRSGGRRLADGASLRRMLGAE
jgi:hypothetical protein